MGINETNKQRNQQVYEYSKAFAIKALSECKLFTDTFGKNFARKRIPLNYKTCYTNVTSNTGIVGYLSSGNASITLCLSGKDDALLSVSDIEGNEESLSVVLHEVVHACLERTKSECSKRKILYGTGILERYQGDGYTYEIGRGLNEGYTNWVCEKAGYKCDGYVDLTAIMRELEIVLGPEKAMALGNGSTQYFKIFEALGNRDEVISFLSKIDFIYSQNESKREYDAILGNLSKIERDYLRESTDTIESIEAELGTLPKYAKRNENPEYIKYVSENGGDTLENQLEYFSDVRKRTTREIRSTRQAIEETIFENYLLEDFKKLQAEESPSEAEMMRFSKFFDIIESSLRMSNKYQSFFCQIADEFMNRKTKEISTQIQNSALSIEEVLEFIDEYPNNYGERMRKFFVEAMLSSVSLALNFNNPEGTEKLIKYLQERNQLGDFEKYKILGIKKYKGEYRSQVDVFIKDGKIVGYAEKAYDYMGTPNNRSVSDEIETDPEELFDITLSNLEKMQNVVNQILQMKEKLKEKDPDAKITILGNAVLFSSSVNGMEAFIIDENEELKKAELEFSKPKTLPRHTNKSQTNLPATKKDNIFSRWFLNIKRKLFRNETNNINFSDKEESDGEILNTGSTTTDNPWRVEDYEERKEEYYKSRSNDSSKSEINKSDNNVER